MPSTTHESHAVGDSIVPQKIQEKAPLAVENALPNAVHDTGKARYSHNTGDSKVPRAVQNVAPTGLEKALPNKVHDTKDL